MKRLPWLSVLLIQFLLAAPAPASAVGRMWGGFRGYWNNVFASVGGVVGTALVVGALGIFIITRGRWIK